MGKFPRVLFFKVLKFYIQTYKSFFFIRCVCGHLVTQHGAIQTEQREDLLVQVNPPQEKWTVLKHTKVSSTDAYGTIEFQGGGFVNKAMVQIFHHIS